MSAYRIFSEPYWIKLHPKTGALKARPPSPEGASVFDTEQAALDALARAVELARIQLASHFSDGEIPDGLGVGFNGPQVPREASKDFIAWRRLGNARVEEFEPIASLEERASQASQARLCAIVCEEGFFLRQGATGWCSFVPELEQASLFPSPKLASDFFEECSLREADRHRREGAKIAQFALSLQASLEPGTLEPSNNRATAMIQAVAQEVELSEAAAGSKSARARPGL